MNSEGLSHALRPYLLLFMKLILESPVIREEKRIPYEEVVFALERDTIHTTSGIGLGSNSSYKCGPFSHVAMLTMQIETKKYETVANWIIDLLRFSIITAERVRIIASKMYNGISEVKRNVGFMVSDVLKCILYSQDSNTRVLSVLKHQQFLGALLERLDKPDQKKAVLYDINAVRNFLIRRENLSLHIATNISEHTKRCVNLSKVWGRICLVDDGNIKNELRLRVIPDWMEIDYKGLSLKDGVSGTVVGMGSVETTILLHAVESINDHLSPDLPALMLYLQYFSQMEGPLWKQIRGQGLAYSSSIFSDPNEGLILFLLYRSANVVAAYKEASKIIKTHLESRSWDESLLESARSSLIFKVIESEQSVGKLVSKVLSLSYQNVTSCYNQTLVKQINKVTKLQMEEVGEKYISRLFSAEARTGIVCHTDKVKEIVEGFASLDIRLSAASCLDESILNS